jgi:hypothetical protein
MFASHPRPGGLTRYIVPNPRAQESARDLLREAR